MTIDLPDSAPKKSTRTSYAGHKLTAINIVTLTANCAICGPVTAHNQGIRRGAQRWRCAVSVSMRRKALYVNRPRSLAPHEEGRKRKAAFTERHFVSHSVVYRHSISMEAYAEMFDAQGGACKLCAAGFSAENRPMVDHDHSCCPIRGRTCGNCIRSLLCQPCNLGLGSVEKFAKGIGMAAVFDYLNTAA